jgi:arsenate reductase (glutaredoxin)
MKLYGIANCDTVKRARAWLNGQGVAYAFHDFKKNGVPEPRLDVWLQTLGHELLINRQGTTWRKLSSDERDAVEDNSSARVLMLEHSSVIKRPVMEWADGEITVGFSERIFAARCALQAEGWSAPRPT